MNALMNDDGGNLNEGGLGQITCGKSPSVGNPPPARYSHWKAMLGKFLMVKCGAPPTHRSRSVYSYLDTKHG
jgi:hypothetical protein